MQKKTELKIRVGIALSIGAFVSGIAVSECSGQSRSARVRQACHQRGYGFEIRAGRQAPRDKGLDGESTGSRHATSQLADCRLQSAEVCFFIGRFRMRRPWGALHHQAEGTAKAGPQKAGPSFQ